ncbi:MAG TPA: HAD-IA family hydrolase [bacterium]|nr:HAD-IA family hydrolase [bacterium]
MNIIFDLGGVLVDWEPQKIFLEFFKDPALAQKIYLALYTHADWAELDRGTLSAWEAAERVAQRTGVAAETVQQFLLNFATLIKPKNETIKLIQNLKNDGHKLFCLSNINPWTFEYLNKHFDFFKHFLGIVISSHEKLVKPDPKLYARLVKRYNILPQETIYIDDLKENLGPAQELGMPAILFQSSPQCEQEIQKLISQVRLQAAHNTLNFIAGKFSWEGYIANYQNTEDKVIAQFVLAAEKTMSSGFNPKQIREARLTVLSHIETSHEEHKTDYSKEFELQFNKAKRCGYGLAACILFPFILNSFLHDRQNVSPGLFKTVLILALAIMLFLIPKAVNLMRCPNCKKMSLRLSDDFCAHCGVRLRNPKGRN